MEEEDNFEQGNEGGNKGAPEVNWRYSKDITDIQQGLSLFAELLDTLSPNEDPRKNELIQEFYNGTFKNLQDKLMILIDNCQDDEVMLPELLEIHDWMEGTLTHYTMRIPKTDHVSIMNNNITTNNKGNTKTTTNTQTFTTTIPLNSVQRKSSSDSDENDSDDDDDSEDELVLKIEKGNADVKGKGKVVRKGEKRQILVEEETGDAGDDEGEDNGEGNDDSSEKDGADSKSGGFKVGYRIPQGPGSCPICCEDEIPANQLYIFDQCGHMYCKECLSGYYNNIIAEGKVLDIGCPNPTCETQVEYHQVQDVVTAEQFAKYEEFAFLAALNADPSVKWCPKPGCGNAVIGDPLNPHCQCTSPECKYEFCFSCSEPWHPDASCEQYQQWKVDNGLTDTKFDQWAKKHTKKCPRCKTAIEKMAGCNHMTCWNCKMEFCWLCGGKYSGNHFDIFNVFGCPGMQSGTKQFGVARRVGMRALIGTGIVLGGIIGTALAIPAAVVAGPIYGGYKLHQRRRRIKRYHF